MSRTSGSSLAKTTAVSGPGARSICRAAAVRSRASSPPARPAAARISASPSSSSLVRSCPAAWRLARSASQERYGSASASMVKTHRPTLSSGSVPAQRSLSMWCIGASRHVRSAARRYFREATSTSWPSLKMSAVTSRTAPTSRFTGYRPPSTAGATASITTVRRGWTIAPTWAPSRGQREAERRGARLQHGAPLGPGAPELVELVLRGPVPVPERERTRVLDERDGRADALGRGRLRHPLERAPHGAVHRGAHGRQIELDAERLRLGRNPEDALRDGVEGVEALELVARLPLEHVPRDQPERLRDRHVHLAEIVDELSVLLPDAPVRFVVPVEHRADEAREHAPALVEEQVGERKGLAREVFVHAADDVRDAPLRPAAQEVRAQRVVRRLVFPRAGPAREIVAPVVDEGVHHLARFAGRQRAHADAGDAERGVVGSLTRFVEARDPVGVDARLGRVVVEEPGDRVVGDDATEIHRGRADEPAVDLAAVGERRDVARGRLEAADQLRLEPATAEVAEILEGDPGVAEDLHRLEPADLVEEPAARGVHEQPVTRELEESPDLDTSGRVQRRALVCREERVEPRRARVEEHLDVGVARGPRILEVGSGTRT